MELLIERKYKKDTYTLGSFLIEIQPNSGDFVKICDTLEDKDRGLNSKMSLDTIKKLKVKSQTAIPTGRYKLVLSWSPKFKCIMPEILGVPGYSGIRIHWGNTSTDTDGCPLVGENKVKGKVINSKSTYIKLLEILKTLDDDMWITIK